MVFIHSVTCIIKPDKFWKYPETFKAMFLRNKKQSSKSNCTRRPSHILERLYESCETSIRKVL